MSRRHGLEMPDSLLVKHTLSSNLVAILQQYASFLRSSLFVHESAVP